MLKRVVPYESGWQTAQRLIQSADKKMTRLRRVEVFAADEVAIVHVMDCVVRRCLLLGDEQFTVKNYDHRKNWIQNLLKRFCSEI